jgi:hypothetical protein
MNVAIEAITHVLRTLLGKSAFSGKRMSFQLLSLIPEQAVKFT